MAEVRAEARLLDDLAAGAVGGLGADAGLDEVERRLEPADHGVGTGLDPRLGLAHRKGAHDRRGVAMLRARDLEVEGLEGLDHLAARGLVGEAGAGAREDERGQPHVLAALLDQHPVDLGRDLVVGAPDLNQVDAGLDRVVEDVGRALDHPHLFLGLHQARVLDQGRGVEQRRLGERRFEDLVLLDGEEPARALDADALIAEAQLLERSGHDLARHFPVVDRHRPGEPRVLPDVELLEAAQHQHRLLVAGQDQAVVLVIARGLEARDVADVLRAPDQDRVHARLAHRLHDQVIAPLVLGEGEAQAVVLAHLELVAGA